MKPKLLIFGLAALGIGMSLYFHTLMPERVATHFDYNGVPNGWMTRNVLVIFNSALFLLMASAFTLIPFKVMNIPNRDYWLAPSRIKDTEAVALGMYTRTGIATMLFIMAVLCLMYRANLSGQVNLGQGIWIYMAVFVIYIVWETIRFMIRFKKVN